MKIYILKIIRITASKQNICEILCFRFYTKVPYLRGAKIKI